jgi:hypothetical protein
MPTLSSTSPLERSLNRRDIHETLEPFEEDVV